MKAQPRAREDKGISWSARRSRNSDVTKPDLSGFDGERTLVAWVGHGCSERGGNEGRESNS
jgi:hypothetical protein